MIPRLISIIPSNSWSPVQLINSRLSSKHDLALLKFPNSPYIVPSILEHFVSPLTFFILLYISLLFLKYLKLNAHLVFFLYISAINKFASAKYSEVSGFPFDSFITLSNISNERSPSPSFNANFPMLNNNSGNFLLPNFSFANVIIRSIFKPSLLPLGNSVSICLLSFALIFKDGLIILNKFPSVKLLNSAVSFSLKKLLSSSLNNRSLFSFNEFNLYNFLDYS